MGKKYKLPASKRHDMDIGVILGHSNLIEINRKLRKISVFDMRIHIQKFVPFSILRVSQ